MTYEGLIKKLYRRGNVSFSDSAERGVNNFGISFNWNFPTPGYFSFDYMCDVPIHNDGVLPKVYFKVFVDGRLRFRARAAWAWNRVRIYVDEGAHDVRFITEDYTANDSAKIRLIDHRYFDPVNYLTIEATSMPKQMESVNTYPILNGAQRHQRTGKRGTELEFVIVFQSMSQWRSFMITFEDDYIISGDYGVYGGVLLPQDTETTRAGGLVFTRTKMNSPLAAGIGVEGL